ncbi:MAG: ATP-binding protein [Gemmatimonadetes bacterium]|nr:MAG: ATP-binding protein [Gemmatimonadota bacterium]
MPTGHPLGTIVRGSLTGGLEMKLNADQSVEDIRAGKFVVVHGDRHEFFSMITDVQLDSTQPQALLNPPDSRNDLLFQVLQGTTLFGTVKLKPMLMLARDEADAEHEARPVKTIPVHFAPVRDASEEDVGRVFGSEAEGAHFFNIGTPLDMETPVCLNLKRFCERSNGIFGKTGTGKTFLTRLALCGTIKSDLAVNLIFDMHSEYGFEAYAEGGGGGVVKGLKQLFPSKVAVFSLDPESAKMRNITPDWFVEIPYDQIQPDDVATLAKELNLTSTAVETSFLIFNRYKRNWLTTLLDQYPENLKEFAEDLGANANAVGALYRKLKRLESLPFLSRRVPEDAVQKIMTYLDRGRNIVLEFGRQSSMLSYMLVANILTRRIHELYIEKAEKFLATKRPEHKPRQLMITIEEAHKFLDPETAKQTIFGTIAREMRKYFVSLLIVDQRPSGIDPEVLSQIGTRITALLNDEKDISAVMTGVSGSEALRNVLASLDTRQQALIFGHAVPMPVVIRTRNYDHQFYKEMGHLEGEHLQKQAEKNIAELFGE